MIPVISGFNPSNIQFGANIFGRSSKKIVTETSTIFKATSDSFTKETPKGLSSKLPVRFDDIGSTPPPDDVDPILQTTSGSILSAFSTMASA